MGSGWRAPCSDDDGLDSEGPQGQVMVGVIAGSGRGETNSVVFRTRQSRLLESDASVVLLGSYAVQCHL